MVIMQLHEKIKKYSLHWSKGRRCLRMIEWNGKKLAEEISNHISDSVSSDDNSVYISREKFMKFLKSF